MNKWDTVILNNGIKCTYLGQETSKGVSNGNILVRHKDEHFICNIDDIDVHVPMQKSSSNLFNGYDTEQ
jgi:hypothetical protein